MSTAVAEIQEKQVAPWVNALTAAEPKFLELAASHPDVNWKAEANFARQILQNNDFLAKCNPGSIRDSVINLGAIGLSLNPALKEAYLVPRGGKCVLDVSYTGMIRLATDTGRVEFMRADVVYANDSFVYNGPSAKAQHSTSSPFDIQARGAIVGFYAEAKLTSGEWLTEILPTNDIEQIRKASKAKSGPWIDYYTEMGKKASLKRLFKTLPRSEGSERMAAAIHVINEHEGSEDEQKWQPSYTADEHERFHKAIESSNGIDLYIMSQTCAEKAWIELYGSFPHKKKVSGKELANKLEASGREACQAAANQLDEYFPSDDIGANEILNDFSESELECVFAFCTNETVQWARELLKEA